MTRQLYTYFPYEHRVIQYEIGSNSLSIRWSISRQLDQCIHLYVPIHTMSRDAERFNNGLCPPPPPSPLPLPLINDSTSSNGAKEDSTTPFRMGHIELIIGPMASGKSTELGNRLRKYTVADMKCILLISKKDKRYTKDDDLMSTHDLITYPAKSVETLDPHVSLACEHDVIGIDEGHFFPGIVGFCDTLVSLGKVVIVASLDSSWQMKPFKSITELVSMAEFVDKRHAICVDCKHIASFNRRNGPSQKLELVGGLKDYSPVCRTCFCKNAPTF